MHFETLYFEVPHFYLDVTEELLFNIPKLVSDSDNILLTRPVSNEEVLKVICQMDPNKDPSLDGFSTYFYQECWKII